MTRNKKLVKMMALAVAASTVATSVPAYAAFDATYYAQQNPDVVAAIGTKPADLETHYNVFGKKEGRAGSADEIGSSALRQLFDAEYYAKLNPDVVAVYGNDANALFSHFLQFGIKEGRKINPYFDVNAYKKAYPDLVAAFGDDIAAYYNHFATNGIKEHRTLGGFPAEKIVPGGVAVASSGGSSSSSSGGGGGSSKPAPKPAEEQVTPTPDPTPTPQPEPEPEPEPTPAPTSQDLVNMANSIKVANADMDVELSKYYGDDDEQDAVDLTKAERDSLVNRALDNLNSAEDLKTQAADNLKAVKAEKEAADKAYAVAEAAVKASSNLSAFADNKTVVKNVVSALGGVTYNATNNEFTPGSRTGYYGALEDLADAKKAADEAAVALADAKALAKEAQAVYDKALDNAKTTYMAVDDRSESVFDGLTAAGIVEKLEEFVDNTPANDTNVAEKASALNGEVEDDELIYALLDGKYKYNERNYNKAKEALTAATESTTLKTYQQAYFISVVKGLNSSTDFSGEAEVKVLSDEGKAKLAQFDLSPEYLAVIKSNNYGTLTYDGWLTAIENATDLTGIEGAEAQAAAKAAASAAAAKCLADGTTAEEIDDFKIGDGDAAKTLSEAQTAAVNAALVDLNDKKEAFEALNAGNELSKAITILDNATKAVTADEKQKDSADKALEKAEEALKKAEDDVTDAIAERDKAYAEAGVENNAELLARDEALIVKAETAYEEQKAIQADDLAKEAYADAKDNYVDAVKLEPKTTQTDD